MGNKNKGNYLKKIQLGNSILESNDKTGQLNPEKN
jgi:hypothetical protein